MRYLIKQRLLSLSDGFTIKDENGDDSFQVKGKVISIGAKLTMSDMEGKEVCYIEQKVFKLMPEYHVSVESEEVMTVKQKFAVLGKKFNITGASGEYNVEGDIIAKDFRILKGGAVCASVSKKLVAMTDTYTVEISDGEDPVLMLAIAVIMDMTCHDPK